MQCVYHGRKKNFTTPFKQKKVLSFYEVSRFLIARCSVRGNQLRAPVPLNRDAAQLVLALHSLLRGHRQCRGQPGVRVQDLWTRCAGTSALRGVPHPLTMEFLLGNPFSTPVGQRIGEPLLSTVTSL